MGMRTKWTLSRNRDMTAFGTPP